MITNYAIIDHVGQVSAISELYKRAFEEASGFEKVYTLKKVCKMGSPYAREVTNKMKWFNRFNRNPAKVFMVCSDAFDPKVLYTADAWLDRGIEVEFITENPEPTVFLMSMSRARRCAMIWADALGWTFSHPVVRNNCFPESIDMYTARPNNDETIENGSYGAKRNTKPESFINAFRAVASEEECEAFMQHYAYLYKNNLLEEFLEPGYHLCPTCRRPVRETADSCQWCETKFDAVTIDTFWEDSYNDDPDWNYEPQKASNSDFSVNVTSADLATKNYKVYLADGKVRDSGKFYFPKANEVKTVDYNNMTLSPETEPEEKTVDWRERRRKFIEENEWFLKYREELCTEYPEMRFEQA